MRVSARVRLPDPRAINTLPGTHKRAIGSARHTFARYVHRHPAEFQGRINRRSDMRNVLSRLLADLNPEPAAPVHSLRRAEVSR